MSETEIFEVYVAPGSEVLILPKTYISRKMFHLAPLQPLQGLRRTTLSTTYGLTDSILPSSSLFIRLRTFKEHEILTFPPKSRLCFLYGLPGHGTTTVMINQIVRLQQNQESRNRWMTYMDLRRVIPVISKQGFDKTWTLPKMIIAYNKVTKPEMVSNIQRFFEPVSSGNGNQEAYNNNKEDIMAELFLDEIDELTPEAQESILEILKNVDWNTSRTRVWVACRPHLKPCIDRTMDEDCSVITAFELMPLTREEQILLWVDSWKLNFPSNLVEQRLRRFSNDLHTHMEHHFPNFARTLGACPSHLQLLAGYFEDTVKEYVTDLSNISGTKSPLFNISTVKILECLVKGKQDAYISQWLCDQQVSTAPKNVDEMEQSKEGEFRRLQKLQVKFAIETYANEYSSNIKVLQSKEEFDVFRLGIIFEMNGVMEFLHPKYGDFIIAQFFVDSLSRCNVGPFQVSFFLNNVLFEDKCKSTRKYFNDYLALQQDRKKVKRKVVFGSLRQFLSQHYSLREDDGRGLRRGHFAPTVSYDDIKTFGSVVHLTIMEGNLYLYELMINSFRPSHSQLRRLLQITAPLEIFNNNPFSCRANCTPETHTVTAFDLLALFGRGDDEIMERLVDRHIGILGRTNLLSQYFRDGQWTPLHYAGMSSNHHFLNGVFSPSIKMYKLREVNFRNPKGQHPSHMVLASECWYYGLKILDPQHSTVSKGCSSSSKPIKRLSSNKKGNGVKGQPVKKEIQSKAVRIVDPEALKKSCKEIWAFEGTSKDFNESWDHHFYPSKGEYGYLQPHLSTLSMLFRNGGNVNSQQDGDGNKGLLHLSASYSSPKLTRFLVQSGVDPRMVDSSGKRPAYYAENNGHADVLLQLLMGETQQEAIKAISSRNTKGENGK